MLDSGSTFAGGAIIGLLSIFTPEGPMSSYRSNEQRGSRNTLPAANHGKTLKRTVSVLCFSASRANTDTYEIKEPDSIQCRCQTSHTFLQLARNTILSWSLPFVALHYSHPQLSQLTRSNETRGYIPKPRDCTFINTALAAQKISRQ